MTVPVEKFDEVYEGRSPLGELVPWEIGEAQPLVVGLEAAGGIRGDVLDAGCGSGEHAMFLAGKGYSVTGVDFSPAAIRKAGEKAGTRGLDVEFAVSDATVLEGYDRCFDTVVDSMLFHTMDTGKRLLYAKALLRAVREGGTVYVMGVNSSSREALLNLFGETVPEGVGALVSASTPLEEWTFRSIFTEGWEVASVEERTLLGVFSGHDEPVPLPAWLAVVKRV